MPYRIVAIDIDHTLLNEAGHITPRVREAVVAAIEQGVHITLATGRRLIETRAVAAELGIKLPVIMYHGALLYDMAVEEALSISPLAPDLVRMLVEHVRAHDLQPFIYQSPCTDSSEPVYTGPAADDDPSTEPYRMWLGERMHRVEGYSELAAIQNVLAVSTIGSDVRVPLLNGQLCTAEMCYTVCTPFFNRLGQMALDMIDPSTSKAAALTRFAARYGVPMSEVMAIGDGINDREMIGAAGFGVAMGNAVPEVQACAAAMTATNEEDGVAQALERWVLA